MGHACALINGVSGLGEWDKENACENLTFHEHHIYIIMIKKKSA